MQKESQSGARISRPSFASVFRVLEKRAARAGGRRHAICENQSQRQSRCASVIDRACNRAKDNRPETAPVLRTRPKDSDVYRHKLHDVLTRCWIRTKGG